MEQEFGRINKNAETDIIVRADEYKGSVGITIREFTRSERYTGFTKSGTRIPAAKWQEFVEIVNKVKVPEPSETKEAESNEAEE